MTFASNMQAIEQDAVPELYRFISGGYEWRYTSYKTNLTFIGDVYTAAPIQRGALTFSSQPGGSKVSLLFPMSDPMKKFISNYPLPSTVVQIYQAVSSDLTQYALFFEGKIMKVSVAGKVMTAECAVDDALSTMLPHIVYQSYCNWQVFDCDCGLTASDYEVPAVVTVSASSLISATFATYESGWFTQGRIRVGGDYRFVTNHDGSQVDLQIPFGADVITGGTVYAYPGCDGAPATCRTKFNNFTVRHVSMSYIPSHNPIIWGFK